MIRRRSSFAALAHYLGLGIVFVIMVFPLVWMFRVAFMEPGSSASIGAVFGSSWTLSNFVDLFAQANIGRAVFNSVVVGGAVTLGNIMFCFMVAYALARYRMIENRLVRAGPLSHD
jgi:multiple sugar transport system permease protein